MTIYSLCVELTENKNYRLSHLATRDGKTQVLRAWEASALEELRDIPQSWGKKSATHIWFKEQNIPLENAYIPAMPPAPVSETILFDISSQWAEPTKYMYKKTDADVALDATKDSIVSIGASVLIVGRYWWNCQMRLLRAVGLMPAFRSNGWLFFLVGALLFFVFFPLGVVFAFSAWSAGQMELEAENDFIVPLKHDHQSE